MGVVCRLVRAGPRLADRPLSGNRRDAARARLQHRARRQGFQPGRCVLAPRRADAVRRRDRRRSSRRYRAAFRRRRKACRAAGRFATTCRPPRRASSSIAPDRISSSSISPRTSTSIRNSYARRRPRSRARSCCCLQLENNLDAIAAALELGTRHGLLRILNPAPVHPDLDASLLAQCDLITPNETEFALLVERFAVERVAASTLVERPNSELHALARELGVGTVVVTLGAEGCFVSHDEHSDRRGDAKSFYRVPRRESERDRFDRRRRCVLGHARGGDAALRRSPVPRRGHAREPRRGDVDRDRRHGAGDAAVRRRPAVSAESRSATAFTISRSQLPERILRSRFSYMSTAGGAW